MKAITHRRYGPPDVLALEEVPRPEPGPGDVLVRVRAAAIYAGDRHIVRGSPFFIRFATGLRRPKQLVPGLDLAGVVEGVGSAVTDFQVGDDVFGYAAGSLAEFVRVPAGQLARRPADLTHEQAAAIPEAGMTALQGLRDQGRVRAGQSVLVIGASGGVGTFAVQIARALGGNVTGVCGPTNLEMVRSIGAEHVVDYTSTDVATGGIRYDVIFQAAGTATPRRLRRILTPSGTLVLSSGQGRVSGIDRVLQAVLLDPFVKERLAVFVTKENGTDLGTLAEMVTAGQVRPVIDRTYPLAQAADAFRYLEAGHAHGKVVITV